MATDDSRYPIKVVAPAAGDYFRPPASGQTKQFGVVDNSVRLRLAQAVTSTLSVNAVSFQRYPGVPTVARVQLKPEAWAKSYRPTALFNERTCPIIGVPELGTVLVSMDPAGARAVLDKIQRDETKAGVAAISTLAAVRPYHDPATEPELPGELLEAIGKDDNTVKVRLFIHGREVLDRALQRAFESECRALNAMEVARLNYASGLAVYKVRLRDLANLRRLSSFVGVQSLGTFERFQFFTPGARTVRDLRDGEVPPPRPEVDYPVVGVVDSGIKPDDSVLSPWVVARHDYVPAGYHDYDHGTFVSGLVVAARELNDGDTRFPLAAAKIVDVTVIPASGGIREENLLAVLEEVIPLHPEVRVWNLSMGSDTPCDDYEPSYFAAALDELQDRFGVAVVLAAGNFTRPRMRPWPPPHDLGEADRLAIPGESVRSLTVGARAHAAGAKSVVKAGQPSPFSRRGPGAVYSPKPELAHLGGNCDADRKPNGSGVRSLTWRGEVGENVGTSFAAPLVSVTLAKLQHEAPPDASMLLLKALIIHASALAEPCVLPDFRYVGFGTPPDPAEIVRCRASRATLVFEFPLNPTSDFARSPFPIPPSLRDADGKVRGEIVMTLAYDPPVDPSKGAEYCRTNVDASFGTYDYVSSVGKRVQKKVAMEEPAPSELRNQLEGELVKHGLKWSPIKVYRKRLRGLTGNTWRLLVNMLARSEFNLRENQRVVLVMSLLDPEDKAPVYDEMVALMNQYAWVTSDLRVNQRIRVI